MADKNAVAALSVSPMNRMVRLVGSWFRKKELSPLISRLP
jgi:hypothetical protein